MNEWGEKFTEEEIARINRIQTDFFSGLIHLFDPPLPDGVPERLDRIVATARIRRGDVVLDVGSGTGVLVPLIEAYGPERIYACDLSVAMLEHLRGQYHFVQTVASDVRDMTLSAGSVDVVFVNACYPNIVDKKGSIANMARMMKPQGRLVISHPMGKSFIDALKKRSPFPLDDFPDRWEAETLLRPFGLDIEDFVDEPDLYILLAARAE